MDIFNPRIFVFFVLVATMMMPLERFFALRKTQKLARPGWRGDLLHLVLTTLITRLATAALIVAVAVLLNKLVIDTGAAKAFQRKIASQPIALQFVEAVVVYDFAGYWAHRLAHEWSWLWRFHAVHHSSVELDWLSSTRLHFIDEAIERAIKFVPIFLLGFSKETFGILALIGPFLAFLVHANVKISFGPLRWFYVSPQYHRWHHALEPRDRNFAPSLPVFDLIFGTAHCPRGQWPERYGIAEPMPDGWFAQLAHPFRPRRPAPAIAETT